MAILPYFLTQFGLDPVDDWNVILLDPASGAPFALSVPVVQPDAILQNPSMGFRPGPSEGVFLWQGAGEAMTLMAAIEGKHLVMAPSESALSQVRSMVRDETLKTLVSFSSNHLSCSFQVGRLVQAYRPLLDSALNLLKSKTSSAAADSEESLELWSNLLLGYLGYLEQVHSMDMELKIEPDGLRLVSVAHLREHGSLRVLLPAPADGMEESAWLGRMSPDAAVIGMVNYPLTSEMAKAWVHLIDSFVGGTFPADKKSEILSIFESFMLDNAAAFSGQGSFAAMIPQEKNLLGAIYRLKDRQKAIQVIEKTPQVNHLFFQSQPEAGGVVRSEIFGREEEAGTLYLGIKQKIVLPDEGAQQAEERTQTVFSEAMTTTTYAVSDKEMAVVMGVEGRSLADRMLAAAPTTPPCQPKQFGFSDHPSVFVAWSLARALRWSSRNGLIPGAFLDSSSSSLCSAAILSNQPDGKVRVELKLGAADFAALGRLLAFLEPLEPSEPAPAP